MKNANAALRFALELCALAALAYWGFWVASGSLILSLLFGIGAPVAAALFWGLFVAPKARIKVSLEARMLLGLLVMWTAGAALAASGHLVLALVYGALALVSAVATYVME